MTTILFSFDNTGSMRPCTVEVRRRLRETALALFSEIPNLRIGAIAHGDYVDYDRCRYNSNYYLTRGVDFTNDVDGLTSFFDNVPGTGGEGAYAAYEYVLEQALRNFSWDDNGVLVVVGDERPNTVQESMAKISRYRVREAKAEGYDWRALVQEYVDRGIKIHGVQCLYQASREQYYRAYADYTGGNYLQLHQFADMVEILMAVAYKQVSNDRVQTFADSLESGQRLNRGLAAALDALLTDSPKSSSSILDWEPKKDYGGSASVYRSYVSAPRYSSRVSSVPDGLVPVPPSRFQILHVDRNQDIRGFVESTGATFQVGRGFYELTAPVTVQEQKEVVVVNPQTGDMFTGTQARDLIGLPLGRRGIVSRRDVRGGWDVFIQSTSYNRKLLRGTRFLYEVQRRS